MGPVADVEVFRRHLDLSRLRGRSRGVVTCIFHPNHGRTPSLSVDLDKGLFFCHACGEKGGLLRFRQLVGEGPQHRPTRGRPGSGDYQDALRALLRRERGLAARRAEWWAWEVANGYVRECRNAVDDARRWGRVLGDHPRTWNLLALAARVEQEAHVIESRLDAILEGGRLHE